jgi:hypothetical protein
MCLIGGRVSPTAALDVLIYCQCCTTKIVKCDWPVCSWPVQRTEVGLESFVAKNELE